MYMIGKPCSELQKPDTKMTSGKALLEAGRKPQQAVPDTSGEGRLVKIELWASVRLHPNLSPGTTLLTEVPS